MPPPPGACDISSSMRVSSRFPRRILLRFIIVFISIPSVMATYFPDYEIYHSVDGYNKDVQALAKQYPALIKLEHVGKSRNGDPIYLIRMTGEPPASPAPGGTKKMPIMITFGEHAREFLPVESFFKLVRDLGDGYARGDPRSKFVLQHVELLLVGLVNPDGRRYLEAQQDYCWRGMANGVDVNRNFPWEYGGPGSSKDAKNEEYRGTEAFSEPESRAMRDLAKDNSIAAFLSMHTGAQYIFVPFADTVSKRIKRQHKATRKQLTLANVMWAASKGFYTGTGVVYDMNDYTADGTMADWMSGVLDVPYSITFEMYGVPGDLANCFEQFNPPSSDVQKTLERFHPMYLAAFLHLIEQELGVSPTSPMHVTSQKEVFDWEFHPEVDSRGGDLQVVSLTKNQDDRVDQLKEMCGMLSECVGFSTSGWLKKSLVPQKQFEPWISKPTDGLYIKKVKPIVKNGVEFPPELMKASEQLDEVDRRIAEVRTRAGLVRSEAQAVMSRERRLATKYPTFAKIAQTLEN